MFQSFFIWTWGETQADRQTSKERNHYHLRTSHWFEVNRIRKYQFPNKYNLASILVCSHTPTPTPFAYSSIPLTVILERMGKAKILPSVGVVMLWNYSFIRSICHIIRWSLGTKSLNWLGRGLSWLTEAKSYSITAKCEIYFRKNWRVIK